VVVVVMRREEEEEEKAGGGRGRDVSEACRMVRMRKAKRDT